MTTHSPNLYALIIRLIATQNGRLRATQGHLAHAAFLNILREVAPIVARTLHDMKGRKPFTISPLGGFGHGHDGEMHIKAGQEGWLRVTLLDPLLFQTFIHYFLQPTHNPTIRLQKQTFHVTEILSTSTSHPLAGATSLQHLHDKWQETTRPSDQPTTRLPDYRTIRLTFRTPTSFSQRDPGNPHRRKIVLPHPDFVFGELAGAWDRLTGDDTQTAVYPYADQHVVVAQHDIQTHVYQYGKSKEVGFTGQVTFQILDKENKPLITHLNRLADLAFFTGVGGKTTMGMGQVMRDDDE